MKTPTTLVIAARGNGRSGAARFALVCLAAIGPLVALPVRLEAQCVLSGSLKAFEPNPPGVSRGGTPYLGSGFSSALALYKNGGSVPNRLLMSESYGYSVLDLSNPLNPTALYYHDVRFPLGGPNSVTHHGDGQSNIATIAVSPDGRRAAFSTAGPAAPFNTVVGSPNGNGFILWGDFYLDRAVSTLIQQIGSRYIAYDIHPSLVTAADITTLPSGSLQPLNMASETTTWPGGYLGSIAGNYLIYMANGIQVVDASNPGPAGRITASYPRKTITSADFGDRPIAYYSAAVDPTDTSKLWILAELSALPGENSPSYGLLTVTGLGSGSLAKASAGPIWRVPAQAGEAWSPNPGVSTALVQSNSDLFVLMWAYRDKINGIPAHLYELYSTTVSAWGSVNSLAPPGKFDIPTTYYSNFSAGYPMAGFSIGNSVYAYLPTGTSAYVIPMFCVSQNAPAFAMLTATDQDGAALGSGDSRYFGDRVTYSLNVNPTPANQPLTGWNVDSNFHAGTAFDDDGPGAFPRLKAPDNAAAGSPPFPPATFTMVGPCDYQAGGDPSSGNRCWSSVTTNGAFGGPDFAAPPAAKALAFAFEANNAIGSAGATLFTLNWKVPAAKLQTTQMFAGGSLVSGSDGHPTAYQWSFGPDAQHLTAACTTSSCAPPSPYNARGTHAYSLTARYFVDQAFTTTATGTYTVTDFAPAFTVNGSASGPITANAGQNLNVLNSSRRGAGISASYQYSLCPSPCADGYQVWSAMTDPPPSGSPPTSASIPVPATAGSYALKIRVNYTGGTAYWPDPSGVTFFPVNVVSPLFVTAAVSPSSAIAGQNVTFSCSATGGLPPYSYQWRSPLTFAIPGATQQTYQTTSNVAGNVDAYCFVTDNQPVPQTSSDHAMATFTAPPPVFVNVSASPNPAMVNQTVTFSCNVSGGTGSYTYQWRSPSTSPFVAGTAQTFQTSSPVPTSLQAGCTATDSIGTFSGDATSVTVTGSGGPYSLFVLNPCRVLDTRNPAGPRGGPVIQPAGTPDRAFPVTTFCGIPSDAKAISVNVTVANVSTPGFVSIYRGDGLPTGTSTIAPLAGRTRANNAFLQLSLDGSGTIKVQNSSTGTLDLIVDVNGYFR